jgi:hypothetical protein
MSFKDYLKENIVDDVEKEDVSEQLKKGIEVEKEHKDLLDIFKDYLKEKDIEMPMTDENFYASIANAHIKENEKYYDYLEKMEKEMEDKKE